MHLIPNAGNLPYVETLYSAYLENPSSVDREWQAYFAQYCGATPPNSSLASDFPAAPQIYIKGASTAQSDAAAEARGSSSTLQEQLNEMIRAYRSLGHKAARFDPLNLKHEN
ncbi:MAG: 2-oxoglutarate dehydrogenase E1 subunit family protein, partial [Candidatus Binatia bacterium]